MNEEKEKGTNEMHDCSAVVCLDACVVVLASLGTRDHAVDYYLYSINTVHQSRTETKQDA